MKQGKKESFQGKVGWRGRKAWEGKQILMEVLDNFIEVLKSLIESQQRLMERQLNRQPI